MNLPNCLRAALFVLAASLPATAAVPYLVKDLDPTLGSAGSNPQDIFVTGDGNTAYLSVHDSFNGYYLAKSDGTAEGTQLLYRFDYEGVYAPVNFAQVGSTVFFSGGDSDKELWKTDGTTAGTVQVKNLNSSGSSEPSRLTPMGGLLYFTAADSWGIELWRSDGTEAGTWRVRDIRGGSESSLPHDLTVVGNVLYFLADDGMNGIELWRSDGTEAGTRMVKAVVPNGTYPPDVSQLRRLGDKLVFRADDGVNGPEIWISDGTAEGTHMIKAVEVDNNLFLNDVEDLAVMGDNLYFRANLGAGVGPELWKTDGTADGTVLVKDLSSGASNPTPLASTGSRLFFTATTSTTGREMWVSDGTGAGTFMLPETAAGTSGLNFSSILPMDYEVSGNLFFFTANTGVSAMDLWRSDGTAAGTFRLMQVQASAQRSTPTVMRAYKGGILFAANDGVHGTEPWFSDGTVAGTRMLKDVDPAPVSSLQLTPYWVASGDLLYLSAYELANGIELWRSDGTATGTYRVADIAAGKQSSTPEELTMVGETLFFRATEPGTGAELWKSDGTEAGTVMVKDIRSGTSSSSPSGLVEHHGVLFFRASAVGSGTELWKSDGTEAGTVMVKDILPGAFSGVSSDIVSAGDYVYFAATTTATGIELWRSDGTEAGTVMVKDIRAGTPSSEPFGFTAVGRDLYFAANNNTNGVELWKTDGTEAGTVMVQDIAPGSKSGVDLFAGFPTKAIGDRIFFSANDGTRGPELWMSERSTGGASLMKDIRPGTAGGSPVFLHAHERKLYFTATEDGFIGELWTSDGTPEGTAKVKPSENGGPRTPRTMTSGADRFYYTGYLPDADQQRLWRSDGTAASTAPITGQFAGVPGFLIDGGMIATRTKLFISVSTAALGRELWALDLSPKLVVEHGGTALPATGAEVVWDLAKPEDLNGSRTLVIRNSGEWDLTHFRIELDPPSAASAYQISTQGMPATLLPEDSTSFTVTRTGPAGGPPVKLRVTSSPPGAGSVEVGLVQALPLPELAWDASTVRLNRQTGLYELVLTVSNPGNRPISGFKISVADLPVGVTLRGAGADGSMLYPGAVPPGATVQVTLEFAAAGRNIGNFTPQITVTQFTGNPGGEPAGGINVDRIERLADGSVLIEFPATAGHKYRLEYSDDGVAWKISPLLIEATTNRVQWIDRGPPATDKPPQQVPMRFYRFRDESGG